MAMAGMLLAWLTGHRCNVKLGPRGSTAVTCAARILLASVAAAWAPLGATLLLPNALGSIWITAEALFLAALPVVLPLPLREHSWVQALVLRSVLARIRQMAWAQAAFPRQAARCVRFARCARLAMLAVVPGAPQQAQHALQPEQACWVANVWCAVVVGYLLPSAVVALYAQHARRAGRARLPDRQRGTAAPTGKALCRHNAQWRQL